MLSPITNERQWRDPPCLWFGNCYWKPWELLPVLWRQWRGPSGTVARSEYPPPSFSLNQITKRYTLVAVGDLLPHNQFKFVVDVSLRDFLADADYLITNFEGVITDRPRVNNPIVHRRAAIDWLAELFPLNRTITGVANNHAGDGGYRAFAETCDCLRDAGCHVVGTDEELQIVVDGVLEVARVPTDAIRPALGSLGIGRSVDCPRSLRCGSSCRIGDAS